MLRVDVFYEILKNNKITIHEISWPGGYCVRYSVFQLVGYFVFQ